MLTRFRRSSRLWGLASAVALLGLALLPAASENSSGPDASAVADAPICAPEGSSAQAGEVPYVAENIAAMAKMKVAMSAEPTGDVDHDFVEMMVAHHQGAIDMAVALLRYGKNERLRRLAQEIIVTQQQEIAAMRLALGQALPPSVASPTGFQPTARFSGPATRRNGTITR
jgi:hypothetical protein